MGNGQYEFPFDIAFVLDALGVNHRECMGNENIDCVFCGKPKKLNVDYATDRFRCPHCNTKGGMLDFYAIVNQVTRKDAYTSLKEIKYGGKIPQRRIEKKEEKKIYPIADIDTRHRTYTLLLNALTLTNKHKENLLKRGLSEEAIIKGQYKSTPILSIKNLVADLIMQGLQPKGVPGFYKDNDGQWTCVFSIKNSGILIPCRNIDGKIEGLQIRRDASDDRKYIWLSSNNYNEGTKAQVFCHITPCDTSVDDIIITEGPLKADIINYFSGRTVISVPGVNSLSKLPELIMSLKDRGCFNYCLAYDMDRITNPNVQSGLENLGKILEDTGSQYHNLTWNPFYKGLDDYLLAKSKGE